MLWSLKIWVSDIAALRPWLLMFCVLEKAPCLRESRRAAGNERVRLVVTEAGKDGVFVGEGVVQANVELGFVEPPHGNVREVEPAAGVADVALGIEVDHVLTDVIDQTRRNHVAVGALGLPAVRIDGFKLDLKEKG